MHATWTLPDGATITACMAPGLNRMEAAVANTVPHVIGECGGNLSCATCHVVVAPSWTDRTGTPNDFEDAISTPPTPLAANARACPARSR